MFSRGLIPIALFMLLGVFLAIGLTRDPSELPSELIDRPLPNFDMPSLENEEATISAADILGRGDRVVLLNVFGSWCVACLEEHPLLMEVQDDARLRLVGMDWRDDRDKVRAWLRRHGNPYEMIVFDDRSRYAIALGVTGAPETFVVDRAGRIRYKHTGPISQDDWDRTLSPLIDQLLADAGTAVSAGTN